MQATYINAHIKQGAQPYSAADLMPWSEINHIKATGEFNSREQFLAFLNRK